MKRARTAARRLSREAALQALYAVDAGARTDFSKAAAALDGVAEHFELAPAALAFARELVAGVVAGHAEYDVRLEAASRNWRLARMAVVDRNVLRLAAYELAHGETPPEVALDEAIELARRFGDDASPRFINGVLGALLKKKRGASAAPEVAENDAHR